MKNKHLLNIIKNYSSFKNHDIISLELLPFQGYNNLIYLLKTSLGKYIVKKCGKSLYNSACKKSEYTIQKIVSSISLCHEPIMFDEENSLLIYKFIEAKHKSSLNTTNIKNLALKLKKLHSIKFDGQKFHIKGYFKSHHIDKGLKHALNQLRRYKRDFVLSHNDLNPKNILFANSVKFIDWEYASLNDRYFDLAAICIEFKLSPKKQEIFIKLYFGSRKADFKKLQIFKIIYKYVCYTWQKDRR